MSPGASGSALDFPPLPSRGEPSGLDRHYLPRRGVAGPSVLSSLAPEQESRCRCSPNTDPTRADRDGELRRCVESWPTITDPDPQGLSFDSPPIDSPERSRVDRRKIHFITLRRRGAALPRRLGRRPASDGKEAVIDPPKRRHQPIRSRDETVRRRGDDGPIRPLAVAGLGRDQPTLFLSQHCEATPRERIIRDAGRHRVEDGPGRGVNSFPLDCLASEGRLNVDRDAALTVLAHGCSRGLASRRRGFEEAAPPPLDRRFVATGGTVQIPGDGITVPFERRSHTPILREAALDREPIPVPWLGKRRLGFTFR